MLGTCPPADLLLPAERQSSQGMSRAVLLSPVRPAWASKGWPVAGGRKAGWLTCAFQQAGHACRPRFVHAARAAILQLLLDRLCSMLCAR